MKKYTYVYRFERNGLGCFVGEHGSSPWVWGCKSKEELRIYFKRYSSFKALFKRGYRIKRYKVPTVEVIMLNGECKFPIKYHKLRKVQNIKKDTP